MARSLSARGRWRSRMPAGSASADAAAGLASTMGRGVVAFVCGIFYARILGQGGRGEVALVLTTAGLIGFGSQIVSMPSLLDGRLSQGASERQLTALALRWVLLLAAPVGGAVAVGFALVGRPGAAILVFGLTILHALATMLTYVQHGEGRVVEMSAWTMSGALVSGVVTVGLSLAGALTVTRAVLAFAPTLVLPLVVALVRARPSGPLPVARTSLRVSVACALLLLVLWRSDTYVVASLLSTERLGVYAVGVAVAEIAQVGATGLRAALTPRLRNLDDADVPVLLFAKLNLLTTSALLVAALALGLFGRQAFAAVYGDGFRDAATVALLLLPGMWGFITVNVYMETLQISGDGPRLARILGIAVATNLLVNLTLTRWGGLAIPAISSSLAYLIAGAAVVRRASRRTAVPISALLWPVSRPRTP